MAYLTDHLRESSTYSARDLLWGLTGQLEWKSTPIKRPSQQFSFIWMICCTWRMSSTWYNGVYVLNDCFLGFWESTHGVTMPSNSNLFCLRWFISRFWSDGRGRHWRHFCCSQLSKRQCNQVFLDDVNVTICIVNNVNGTFFLVSQNRRVVTRICAWFCTSSRRRSVIIRMLSSRC